MSDDVLGQTSLPHRRLDDATALTVRDMLLDHDAKIDGILVRFAKIDGAIALMRVAFGASIISAIVSILAVIEMMNGVTR